MVCSVGAVCSGKYKVPDDRVFKRRSGFVSGGTQTDEYGFMQILDGAEELPFD